MDSWKDQIEVEEKEDHYEASPIGNELHIAEAETEEKALSRLIAMNLYNEMMRRKQDE